MMKTNCFILLLAVCISLHGSSLGKVLIPSGLYGRVYNVQHAEKNGEVGADPWRLPEGIKPDSYDIRIVPNLNNDSFSYTGEVSIKVTAQNGTADSITLHSQDLNITYHSVKNDVTGYEMFQSAIAKDGDLYVLNLNLNLETNKSYTILMRFSAKLRGDMFGFYKSSYKGENDTTEWMAATQLEATSARKAFPCFDEPQLKAKFSVSIAKSKDMKTLSNMPLNRTVDDKNLPDGYTWDIYNESPKMSSYLVAFTVSKFESNSTTFKSGETGSKSFTVWAPENTVDQVMYSLNVGPRILEIMHDITGVDYTLPKMDMIAIPDFAAGAMENWGLVTFREADLFYKEGTSSASSRQRVATVTAHELAHQWFGDIVSPEWWKFIWLNEGFATYFMYTATGILEPTWRLTEQFVVEMLQTGFILDAQDAAHPMTYDVNTPDEIYAVFDDIAYNKAGSVIRMMEYILGRNTFFKGLGKYLDSRKFDSGNDEQLFEALDSQAELDDALEGNLTMKDIMKGWTTQVGYPVITVERSYDEGVATIKQERFTLDGNSNNTRWTVPITFTTQAAPNFLDTKPKNWITEDQDQIDIQNLPLGDEWIIFNIQEMGYYRVNYDEKNWELITNYLNSVDHVNIHVLNKAQLICDSLNLARAGYLNYTIALELTSYLAEETDFIPWYSAYQPFEFLNSILENSTAQEKFYVHMQHLLVKNYNSTNFNESSNDDPAKSIGLSQIVPWACKFEYEDCMSMAKKLFTDFQGNISVPVNLKSTVYCYGITSGDKKEWDLLWNTYESTTIASERVIILNALGCSKNEEILEKYLNMTINDDSGIRKQDRTIVFNSVMTTAEGVEVALNYLIAHLAQLNKAYGEQAVKNILVGVANRLSSSKQTDKMKIFLQSNEDKFGVEGKQALKTIDSNIDWKTKYLPTIESWLDEKYPSSSAVNHACMIMILTISFLNYYF